MYEKQRKGVARLNWPQARTKHTQKESDLVKTPSPFFNVTENTEKITKKQRRK